MIRILPLLAPAFFPLFFGFYAFKKRSDGAVQRPLLSIMFLLTTNSVLAIAVGVAPSRELAQLLYPLNVIFGFLLLTAAILHFIFLIAMPRLILRRSVRAAIHIPALGVCIIPILDYLGLTQLFYTGVTLRHGYYTPDLGLFGSATVAFAIAGLVCFSALLTIAYRSGQTIDRTQYIWLMIALDVPTIIFMLLYRLPGAHVFLPPILSAFTAFCFGFLTIQHGLLSVAPTRERAIDTDAFASEPIVLKAGHSYLLKTANPDRGMIKFAELVRKGLLGLCITRTNPAVIRDEYVLTSTPIIWLTDLPGDTHLEGTRLERLAYTIINFLRESADDRSGPTASRAASRGGSTGDADSNGGAPTNGAFIYLEGVSYLISCNGFDAVLRMIQDIKDHVSHVGARFLVTVNPKMLSAQQLSYLEHELDPYTGHAYPQRQIRGSSLYSYFDFVEDRFQGRHLDAIIAEAECEDVKNTDDWYPAEYSILLRNAIRRYYESDTFDVAYEFGKYSVQNLGLFTRWLVKTTSLEKILTHLIQSQQQAVGFGDATYELREPNVGVLTFSGLSGDKGFCVLMTGLLDGLLEIKGMAGRVEHTKCVFRGDECDEFVIHLGKK